MRCKILRCLILLVIALIVNGIPAHSQIRQHEFGIGLGGGVSKYYGEFTDDLFGAAGEASFTYTPWQYLTLGLNAHVNQLQWRITRDRLARYPGYFGANARIGGLYPGTLATIEDRNQSRFSAYEFTAVVNILPYDRIVPFVGAGAGLATWSPTNAEEHTALPNNGAGRYDRLTWTFPVLAGFQVFVTEDLSFYAKGAYRFTLTKYLDDVPFSDSYDNVGTLTGGLVFHFHGNDDPDGDGLSTADEKALGTNPRMVDTDGDGLLDGEEVRVYRTNPLHKDTDDDGLTDGEEALIHHTDPRVADTDGDGLSDAVEVLNQRTNPLNVDTDGDRLFDGEEVMRHKTNPLRADTDYDGVEDADELSCRYQTNPLNPDTDGDGLIDSKDPEPALRCAGCGGGNAGTGPFPYATPPQKEAPPPPPPAPEPKPEPKPEPEPAAPPPAPAPKKRKAFTKDIRFKLNTDEFDFEQPETQKNLQELLAYMQENCDDLQVMLEGHASSDGPAKRNKELSDMRAKKVRQWLIEQGVMPNKIRGAVGYGSSVPRVKEPVGREAASMSREELEAIRGQNRRIEVAILRDCANGL